MSTALLITPKRRPTPVGTMQHAVELPRVLSATSLSVDAEVRAMARPAVPNYALRRLVVGAAAVLVVGLGLVGVVGMAAGLEGAPASAAAADDLGVGVAPTTHVARSGDTMWSIANTYRGDVDRDRYIDALIRLNDGVGIQAGQAVLLP